MGRCALSPDQVVPGRSFSWRRGGWSSDRKPELRRGGLGGQVSQAQASGLLGEDFEGVSIRDRSVGLTLIGG